MAKTSLKKPKKRYKSTAKKSKLAEIISSEEGFLKSYDGTKLWYQAFGKGTPVIFCNGLGCSTFFWKHIQSYLKKKYKVILFDWRCHGQSETPKKEENIHFEALIEDLNAVYKKFKIKKAILIGHSMGTQVLYHFYDKYPRKVMALIPCFGTFGRVMDTFYDTSSSKYIFTMIYIFNHLFPKLANTIGYVLSKNPFWWQMGTQLKMLNPGLADRKILKEYIEHFTSLDSVMLATMAKSMQEYDAEQILKKIKVPTFIIAGEKDMFTPVWLSKKMHHQIPESELLVIKKGSHVALIEQPALINLSLERFIDERL